MQKRETGILWRVRSRATVAGIPVVFLAYLILGIFGSSLVWADKGMVEKRPIPDAPSEYQSLKNPATTERDINYGKRQYKAKCADCHGEKGEGDEEEPEVPKFNDAAYMAKRSDGQLFYIIKFGAGKEAEMEGFGPGSDAALSDTKIWRIVAFVRTLTN